MKSEMIFYYKLSRLDGKLIASGTGDLHYTQTELTICVYACMYTEFQQLGLSREYIAVDYFHSSDA